MSRHKERLFQRKPLDSSTFFSPLLSPGCLLLCASQASWVVKHQPCDVMFHHGFSGSLEAFPASRPCVCGFQNGKYHSKFGICDTIFFCVSFQTLCWTLLPSSSSPLFAPAGQRSREVLTAPSPTLHPSSLCHPACLLPPPPCPSLQPSSPLAL